MLGLLVAGCNQLNPAPTAPQDRVQARVDETFQLSDADNWLCRTPALWKVVGEPGRRYLRMSEPPKRALLPGARRPQEYAIYTPYEFRSFSLSCFVRLDRDPSAATRDVCILFARQDTTRLCYVDLAGVSDAVHNTVMRVGGDTRQALLPAKARPKPIPADRDWHKIDVLRNGDTGLIQVFVDARDEKTAKPYFEVTDKAYEWGFVGVGSFDSASSFARIQIEGEARKPAQPPAIDDSVATPVK